MNCEHLKVGDKVIRILGNVPMIGTVMAIEGDLLRVAMPGTKHWPIEELWTFDRKTGVEEDEGLEWGVKFGRTGSYLTEVG